MFLQLGLLLIDMTSLFDISRRMFHLHWLMQRWKRTGKKTVICNHKCGNNTPIPILNKRKRCGICSHSSCKYCKSTFLQLPQICLAELLVKWRTLSSVSWSQICSGNHAIKMLLMSMQSTLLCRTRSARPLISTVSDPTSDMKPHKFNRLTFLSNIKQSYVSSGSCLTNHWEIIFMFTPII